ncbi:MAG: response regulator [Bryobacterales bacterium]|nr:response regulator [Bryobacterales bacterium]
MKPLRVLLIEDSAEEADGILGRLREAGIECAAERVDMAPAVSAALSLKPWDLILCDAAMPHMTAMGVLALARERRLTIPVIVLSDRPGEEHAVEIMRAGARDYVMKRDLSRLPAIVARELRDSGSRPQSPPAADRFRAFVEMSPLAIFSVDQDGNVEPWNAPAESLFGVRRKEDGAVEAVFSDAERERFRGLVRAHGEGQVLNGVRRRWVRRDGSAMDGMIWSGLLRKDGNAASVVFVVADLTGDEQGSEHWRNLLRMEGMQWLAASLRSDLADPLTVVGGYSRVAFDHAPEDERLREDLRHVNDAAEEALRRAAPVLALGGGVQEELLALNAYVARSERLLREIAGPGIELRLERRAERVFLRTAPAWLTRILIGLALTAREALDGKGWIRIDASAAGGRARLVFQCGASDGGARLLDAAAEVGEWVRLSGGALAAGESVAVEWPLAEPSAGPRPAVLRGAESVLLVDQSEAVRALVREMLTPNGYDVMEALDAEEALSLFSDPRFPVDLLVADQDLPEGGARHLADRLREHRPAMKVLFAGPRPMTEPPLAGEAHLLKPFSGDALLRAVRALCGRAPL